MNDMIGESVLTVVAMQNAINVAEYFNSNHTFHTTNVIYIH